MESVKRMLVWVIRRVVTAALIVFTYIFVGDVLGTIIFFIGILVSLAIIILSLVGMVKGRSGLLKKTGRFELLKILSHSVGIGLILLFTWSVNIAIQEELGPLSATEKIGLIHNAFSSNEKEISAFTQDYSVLQTNHITFRHHPDTKSSVEKMVVSLDAIEKLEKEIYGPEIEKTEPLEVIVLKNADEYDQLNPNVKTADAGIYDPNRKRTIIYRDGVSGTGDDLYVVETFVHEYSHYLLDLFIEQEDLNHREVPIWFNEGIAELMRNRILNSMRLPGDVDLDVSFLDLHTLGEWNQARETNDVYYQAYLAVEYIVGSRGDLSMLSDILVHQKETGEFGQSFDETMAIQLADLHQTITSVDQDLDLAWNTWSIERDLQEADSLYEEVLEEVPYHNLAWQQYAMMHEDNKNWDEAIAARREHIQVNQTVSSLLNLSYMLVLTDSEEAITRAVEATKAAENEPYEHILFYKQWMDDLSRYHQLVTENKNIEALNSIMESDHLSYQPAILEELSDLRTALQSQP